MRKVKKIMEGIAVAAALLMTGCTINSLVTGSNAPFYLAYNSEEVILDQSKVATITSTNGLEIDGVQVTPQNMRSANYSFLKQQIVVADVLPGTYKVKVTADNSGKPIQMEPITYNFEAGRIYRVSIGISRVFVEENNTSDAAQKIAKNRNNAVFKNKN